MTMLGSGTVIPRKRALFGLLDADGWAWATVKSFVWLILIIFLLGYLPDRAYSLTVGRTVDLGVLFWSPINLGPPTNETLPCPAPVGAVVPFEASPPQLALPAGRTDGSVLQVGTQIFYFGGSDGTTAQKTVYVAKAVGTGNFDAWQSGPDLPDARADASVVFVAGSIYVIGGNDASGKPTRTVFVLSPDSQTGQLGEWTTSENLALPAERSGAAVAVATDGILLMGGRDANGVVKTTLKTKLDSTGKLGAWSAEADMFAPQADATAVIIGDFIWLYGGTDGTKPVSLIQRGEFGKAAATGLPANPNTGKVTAWAVSPSANLPVARSNGAGWGANGAIYIAGGTDGTAPQNQVYWATPTTTGNITEWKHLDVMDLPVAQQGGAALISGPNAIIVGGQTASGVVATSVRANTAPQSPYFQLGLVGATVPGLTINGEIGQQLGYLNAAGVGTVNFILLLLVGWAFAHKAQSRAIAGRILHRFRK